MDAAISGEVVSKGQFAALRNVSPSRVSQWISEGKIKPDALVGEGRNAKINVAVATRQLRDSLDIGQLRRNASEGAIWVDFDRVCGLCRPFDARYASKANSGGAFG